MELLATILAPLFNVSNLNDIFLACLKIARVVPNHKSRSKTEVKKYRPNSTLKLI